MGRTIALIHRRFADTLTLDVLAREAGVSKTVLGDRFRMLIGELPMHYCSRWRMNVAADLLRNARENACSVAYSVGFNSEAAFNRAFKREYGVPPAAWQRPGRCTDGASLTLFLPVRPIGQRVPSRRRTRSKRERRPAMHAAVPDALKSYAGRIVDVDSHEMMPAQIWTDVFGEVAKPIAELIKSQPPRPNHASIPDFAGDTMPLGAETLFKVKGPVAPGAVDMDRRTGVMDMMGIRHQLLFPTSIGLWGIMFATAAPDDKMLSLFGSTPEEGWAYGRRLIDAHNEWLVGVARQSSRIKAIAPIYGDTVEELTANAAD